MFVVRHLVLNLEAWVSSWEVCYFNAYPHSDRSKNARVCVCVCKRDHNIAHYMFYQQMFNIDIEEKPGLSSVTFDPRGPGSGDSATGLISTE